MITFFYEIDSLKLKIERKRELETKMFLEIQIY